MQTSPECKGSGTCMREVCGGAKKCGVHVQPWIFAFDAYSLQLTNTYTQPPVGNGTGPGIWQSGAGWAPQSLLSFTSLKLWSLF